MGLMFKIKHRVVANNTRRQREYARAMPLFQYTVKQGNVRTTYLVLWAAQRKSNNRKLKWNQAGGSYHNRGQQGNQIHRRNQSYSIAEFTSPQRRRTAASNDAFAERQFRLMCVNQIERIVKMGDGYTTADGDFEISSVTRLRPACLGYTQQNQRTINGVVVKTNVLPLNRVNSTHNVDWLNEIESKDVWKDATCKAAREQRGLFDENQKVRRATHPYVVALSKWCHYAFSTLMDATPFSNRANVKGYWRTIKVSTSARADTVTLAEREGDFP